MLLDAGGHCIQQVIREQLQPVGRTHIGEICAQLSPVGETPRWSRGGWKMEGAGEATCDKLIIALIPCATDVGI